MHEAICDKTVISIYIKRGAPAGRGAEGGPAEHKAGLGPVHEGGHQHLRNNITILQYYDILS